MARRPVERAGAGRLPGPTSRTREASEKAGGACSGGDSWIFVPSFGVLALLFQGANTVQFAFGVSAS